MATGVQLFVDVQPGLYALMGAVAFLGGVMRSSVSLVVIILEGTGTIQFLLPIILAITISKASKFQ